MDILLWQRYTIYQQTSARKSRAAGKKRFPEAWWGLMHLQTTEFFLLGMHLFTIFCILKKATPWFYQWLTRLPSSRTRHLSTGCRYSAPNGIVHALTAPAHFFLGYFMCSHLVTCQGGLWILGKVYSKRTTLPYPLSMLVLNVFLTHSLLFMVCFLLISNTGVLCLLFYYF